MAADILLYKATVVPVGQRSGAAPRALPRDRAPLQRALRRGFSGAEAAALARRRASWVSTARRKMSKTRGNAIDMFDPPAEIEKKLKGAFTDPQKLRRGDPGRPEICNMFTMHTAVSAPERRRGDRARLPQRRARLRRLQEAAGRRRSTPSSRRSRSAPRSCARIAARVLKVLQDGAARARAIAEATMDEVYRAMGLTTRAIDVKRYLRGLALVCGLLARCGRLASRSRSTHARTAWSRSSCRACSACTVIRRPRARRSTSCGRKPSATSPSAPNARAPSRDARSLRRRCSRRRASRCASRRAATTPASTGDWAIVTHHRRSRRRAAPRRQMRARGRELARRARSAAAAADPEAPKTSAEGYRPPQPHRL